MATTQNFTLKFQADVSQAKKAVQDLNNSLKAVTNANFSNSGISLELEKASIAAQELRTHLMTATNASTGKLNLNDFNRSITASKTNLSSLLQNLANGGQAGQQAFMSFATTVAQSEVPLRKVNTRLASIGTTIKNTIKWQLSSSLINGFIRGISSAIGYVKDLNSSLNDIRIVTNKSVEEMARFAEQANRAAKELSTTTKAYTDASLIYYQQGESAEMAAKKAAITIKAANASFGSSAKEMSQYLTAVWNSYQVGADELERYVDIMASLGANTATSMEEIATSMQKVAATANTVGVSMEQISSIISTVSSVTRESAESIGTSYKTILARIGDLKLGETLEDGVGLGQVSSELDKIGVKILDASGEMRDMGAIIEDIGSKWQTMGRAQQTALAQVVAGKRQYTQFMALFENWDKYQKNMDIASNSSGSLQNMQDTFTESWEGASKRLRASLEGIWQDLLNDEGMIKITNTITKIVEGIGGFVNALGGAKGTLQAFGAMALLVFQKQITNSVIAATASIKNFFTQKNEASQYINNLQHIKSVMADLRTTSDSTGDSIKIDNAVRLIELKETLAQKESKLNDMQKQRAQAVIGSFSEEISIVDQLGAKYDELSAKAKQKATEAKTNALTQAGQANTLANDKLLFQQRLNNFSESATPNMKALYLPWMQDFIMGKQGVNSMSGIMGLGQKMGEDLGALDNAIQRIQQLKSESQTTGQSMSSEFSAAFKSLETAAGSAAPQVRKQIEDLKVGIHTMSPDEISQKFTNLVNSIMRIQYGVPSIDMMVERLRAMGIITDENEQDFREIASASIEAGQAFDRAGHAAEDLANRMKKANTDMKNTKTGLNTVLNGVQTAAAAAMSFSAALTAASNVAKNWDDGNLSSKISGIASAFSSVAMLAGSGAKIGGPWGALVGAVVGIGAAIGGAISGINEAQEEKRVEQLKKHNDQRKESVESLTKENDEIKKLLTNYNSLNSKYLSTGEVTSELITATQQLAEAYGLADSAIISTTEDLEHLQNKITLSTLTQLLETEQEYQRQINSAFLEISTGASARNQNTKLKNLNSSFEKIWYTENEMADMAAANTLTGDQRLFYLDSRGSLEQTYGIGTAQDASSQVSAIAEPLEEWTKATVNDLREFFSEDSIINQLSDTVLQDFINEGLFYTETINGEQQFYGKDNSSNSFIEMNRHGDGMSYSGGKIFYDNDHMSTKYERFYTLGEYEYQWAPELSDKHANLPIIAEGQSQKVNGVKTKTTNIGAQLLGLLDYFGYQDGMSQEAEAAVLKNVTAVLSEFFADEAWNSRMSEYAESQGLEDIYETLVQNIANPEYFQTAESLTDALGQFDFNQMRIDYKNKDLDFDILSSLAENQYEAVQKIVNDNWSTILGDEGENFSFDSFLQVDNESLFTGRGTLIWDDLSGGQALLNQYKRISQASEKITEKKDELQKWLAEQGFQEGTPEFEAVQQVVEELNAIDTIYQQIIGEGTETNETFEPLIAAEKGIEETQIATKLIQDIQNDAVSDYEALTNAINTFDSDPSKFIDESQYDTEEEIAQARENFIQALVKSFGADLETISTLYFSVEEALRRTGNSNSVQSYLESLMSMGITSVDQITEDLQQAIILAALDNVSGDQLGQSQWIIDATQVAKNTQKASDAEAKQTAFQNMVEKRLTDDTAAADLYQMLFNADETAKTDYLSGTLGLEATSLLDYNDFITSSKEEQDAYLELIDKQFDAYIRGIWEQALGLAPSEASVPTDDEIVNYKTLYDQWSIDASDDYKLVGDAQLGYHVTGYAEARNAGYTIQNNKLYKDSKEITTQLTEEEKQYYKDLAREEEYQSASLNYNNAVARLHAKEMQGAGSIDTFANSITVLEKAITDLENEADILNSIDIESAPKAGTVAYEALNKALQKTGKSMSDYIKMSAKDKTKVLGDAQISNLQAQRKQYDALISTYTNKYSDFATTDYATILASGDETKISAYEAYLEAITQQQAIEQNIIDTQEQTAQNLISIGATNTDAAIALFQMEQEKLKDAADKLQEVAQILSENIETGFLTYEQQSKMSAEQLAAWRSKTSQEDRAKYAAELAQAAMQEQLNIQAKANENIASAQQFMSRRATTDSVRLDSAKNFKDAEAFKNLLDESNLDKGVRDALITADSAVRSTLGVDATVGDWGDKMREELEQMGIDGKTTLSTLSAEGKDLMAEIWSSAAKDAKEAAESAYENWVNAFEQIADARAKLLSGENLIEDIAGNPELLAQYAKNAGIDPKELSKMIMSGSVTADTFDLSKSKTEYIDAEKTKYGLDLVNSVGNTVGTVGRANDALAFGLDNTTLDSKATQEALAERYQAILEASNLYGAEATNIAQQLAAGQGDYSLLTAARQHLISAIEGAAEAQEIQRQQTEDLNAATTASQNIIDKGTSTANMIAGAVSIEHADKYQGQSQERLTELNSAIENLREEKYKEDGSGSIENLTKAEQDILNDFGINMGNVDSAAQNTANALAVLAKAAYEAAKAQYEEGQVTENDDGTVTVTNAEGGIDTEASEELTSLKQNMDSASFEAQDVPAETTNFQADSVSMSSSELENMARTLHEVNEAEQEFNDLTADQKDNLINLAATIAKNAQGWEELKESQEDNIDIIKKGDKENGKYYKSLGNLTSTLKKIFGDSSKITEDFVEDHIEDIEKMAEGDEEALERVEDALISDSLKEDYNVNVKVNTEEGVTEISKLGDLIDNYEDQWSHLAAGTVLTPEIDTSGATAALLELVNAGGDTANAIMSTLNSIGWAPEVEYESVPATSLAGGNGFVEVPEVVGYENGIPIVETKSKPITSVVNSEGEVVIPKIGSNGQVQLKGFRKAGSSGKGGKSGGGGGGGGGGSGPKKHDKREPIERYHENTKNYDRISEALEKVNKAKDRAFGKSYLKNLEKERQLLNAQVNLLKQKEDEIQNYYDEDLTNLQKELNDLMTALGGSAIELDINPNTLNIDNWQEIEEEISRLYDQKATSGKLTDEQMEEIDKQLKEYEKMRDQYEETVALLAENGLTIEDLLNQLSEIALEEITYKVEYQVELNEHDLELLEYYQEIFEDDLTSASELMTNLTRQANLAEDNLAIIEQGIQDLKTAYDNGEINDADYYEGLSDLNSQMIDQLSELHDLQEQIAEHYADTLKLAEEEMGAHIDNLEYIADTMEKYREISELMGKGVDREWMKSTLATQIDVNKQKLTSQKAMLEELLKRKEEFEKNMNEDGTFSTELEQQQYEALIESLKEVHSNMLDYITEELEKMKELYETTIEDLFADFEEKMLGTGQSLADLSDKYAYYQETQERHLSAAQELFEMSKLNRQIEQSIEDSTNKANKQILKDLQSQINARAELKEMTEYDIEMMNLQYELALKQMALEEAQNAKSVVRLTRDNDGNYAYQYTADDDKVASAYQEYEDVLQQINDLASGRVGELEQAMLDAQTQYADAAKEIALDMTLTEEQRQAKLEELAKRYEETLLYIQEEYGYATGDLKNNLATVSSWYNTAIVEDSNTAKEQVADMIKNAQTWAQEYANLLTGEDGSVLSAWNNYAEAIASMSDFMDTVMTEEGLANYEQAAAAGDAALQIVEQLSGELDGINATTEAWKKHNLEMENTIKYYQDLAEAMNLVMHQLGEKEETETPPLGDASTGTSDDGTDVSFADPTTLANNVNNGTTTNVQTGATETAATIPDDVTVPGKQMIEWDGRLSDLEAGMLAAQSQYQAIIAPFLNPALTAINRHDYFNADEDWFTVYEDQLQAYEDTLKAYEDSKEILQSNATMVEELVALLDMQATQSYLNMAGMASAQTVIRDSVVNYNTITQHITMANDFPNVEHVQDIKEAIEELILSASQYTNSDDQFARPNKQGGGGGGGGGRKAKSSPTPI